MLSLVSLLKSLGMCIFYITWILCLQTWKRIHRAYPNSSTSLIRSAILSGPDLRLILPQISCQLTNAVGARVAQWVRSLDLTTHTSLSPIRRGCVPGFVNYKKGCTRLVASSDKVYQLLAHDRWFLPVLRLPPPLKLVTMIVALKHQKSKSVNH